MDRPSSRDAGKAPKTPYIIRPVSSLIPSARRCIPMKVLAGMIAVWWPVAAQVQELIVNQDLGHRPLNQNEARLYFSMRLQRWPDDKPVKVFVLPDNHPLHAAFAKNVLGLFPYQLRGVWDRQLFSGTGQAPTTVADEDEMIRRVGSTPGAIGYARANPQDPRVHTLEVH